MRGCLSLRSAFEDVLSELVGRRVTLRNHDDATAHVAHISVVGLFNTSKTAEQLHSAFSAVCVFYAVSAPTLAFFQRFFGAEAFTSVDTLNERVQRYQASAIRLYSSLNAAFEHLSTTENLDEALAPLRPLSDASYRSRVEWSEIEEIPEQRLPDLGYISAARVKKEHKDRQAVASFLVELADGIAARGRNAIEDHTPKKRRRIGSLLRAFNSTLPHDLLSPLFAPDPDKLKREAAQLSPKAEDDIRRMEETQTTGLRNLARYLAADYMDVYVATSMRTDADFASVNTFVRKLFSHQLVHPLKLRYFNPTGADPFERRQLPGSVN